MEAWNILRDTETTWEVNSENQPHDPHVIAVHLIHLHSFGVCYFLERRTPTSADTAVSTSEALPVWACQFWAPSWWSARCSPSASEGL